MWHYRTLLLSLWGSLHVSSMSFSFSPWAGEWRQTFHFFFFLKGWHDAKSSKRAHTCDSIEVGFYLTVLTGCSSWRKGLQKTGLKPACVNHILSGAMLLSSFPLACWDWYPGPVGPGQALSHWAAHLRNLWPKQLNRANPTRWQELYISFYTGSFIELAPLQNALPT